jgi:hypothetical protein
VAHLKHWFIVSAGQVTGPFDIDEVESQLKTIPDALIWGKGQSEWMSAARWHKCLQEGTIEKKMTPDSDTLWKIRIEGQERKPIPYSELLALLKAHSNYNNIEVTNDELGGIWKEIFSIPRLADDLGVTRRVNSRVPITGILTCQGVNENFTCRAISISEGGMGVNDARNIHLGQRFKVSLASPNLYTTINTTCEVVYVGHDGYAGLKFVALPAELKTTIIEYVSKFSTV